MTPTASTTTGVSEAAYHGVPVIGFPLFGDQWDNIARLQFRGMAEMVDSETFTAQSLATVVEQVMADPAYTTNAKNVAAIIQDTPKSPVALAADAIEYGFRHDSALFQRVPGLNDNYFVRNSWDVYGCVPGCGLMSLGLCIRRQCMGRHVDRASVCTFYFEKRPLSTSDDAHRTMLGSVPSILWERRFSKDLSAVDFYCKKIL